MSIGLWFFCRAWHDFCTGNYHGILRDFPVRQSGLFGESSYLPRRGQKGREPTRQAILLSRKVLEHHEPPFQRRAWHHAALSLTAFAVFGLSSCPAHAQQITLQSGDNLTVGSTGTTGTYLGAPISNSTNSYVETTNNTVAVTTPSNSAFTLNAGGSLTNNNGGGVGIFANDSLITINGGSISTREEPIAATGGTVNITGGSLIAGGLAAGLSAKNTTLNISGGTISGLVGLELNGGTANITGGTFSGSPVFNGVALGNGGGSLVTISGGSFDHRGFEAGTNGTIDFLGTFSQTAPITSGTGTLTGTFLDGETLDALYNVSPGGLIEFNSAPVPEASSVVSFGLLLALGLGGMVIAAKRKKIAS